VTRRAAAVAVAIVVAAGLALPWFLAPTERGGDPRGDAAASPAGVATPAVAASSAPPSPPATPAALLGARPLSPGALRRVDLVAARLADVNAQFHDLQALAEHEGDDPPWSDDSEALLQDALLRHGRRLTALQVGRPHCTRTVCRLVAVGGTSTDAVESDWQGLVAATVAEPWFAARFADTNTQVTADDTSLVYITFFVRR
jgi:hypothetical protein